MPSYMWKAFTPLVIYWSNIHTVGGICWHNKLIGVNIPRRTRQYKQLSYGFNIEIVEKDLLFHTFLNTYSKQIWNTILLGALSQNLHKHSQPPPSFRPIITTIYKLPHIILKAWKKIIHCIKFSFIKNYVWLLYFSELLLYCIVNAFDSASVIKRSSKILELVQTSADTMGMCIKDVLSYYMQTRYNIAHHY